MCLTSKRKHTKLELKRSLKMTLTIQTSARTTTHKPRSEAMHASDDWPAAPCMPIRQMEGTAEGGSVECGEMH